MLLLRDKRYESRSKQCSLVKRFLRENSMPISKTAHAILTELSQTAFSFSHSLFFFKSCLREELISIAYQLFFEGFREEGLVYRGVWSAECGVRTLLLFRRSVYRRWRRNGDGQVLGKDLGNGKTSTGMTLTNPGMTGEAFCPHNLCPNLSMTDIWFGTEAFNARRITTEDTDVVEHGRLLHKLTVKVQFRVSITNLQGLICHSPAMNEENAFQRILLWIILINNTVIIHINSLLSQSMRWCHLCSPSHLAWL